MGAKLKLVAPTAAPVIDPESARYELARIRGLAKVWITATPEPQRRDMSALLVRRAFDRLTERVVPDLRPNPAPATPFGKLDATARGMADAAADGASWPR